MPARPVRNTVSLSAFASEHTVALTRFAYVLCGDRGVAEDLVQDAYLRLYRRFGDTIGVDAPLAYARRAIVNGAVSRTRKRSTGEVVLADLPDSARSEQWTAADQGAAWQALATLPQRQRAVLVMRYYLDLPDQEIADLLGCRQGSVRSLAARAFGALRAHPELQLREESR